MQELGEGTLGGAGLGAEQAAAQTCSCPTAEIVQTPPRTCWHWRARPASWRDGRRHGQVHPPSDAGVFCGGSAVAALGPGRGFERPVARAQPGRRDAAGRTGRVGPAARPAHHRLGADDHSGCRSLSGPVRRRAARQPGAGGTLSAGERGGAERQNASPRARATCWNVWATSPSTCAAASRPGCCWAGWAIRAFRWRRSTA